MSSLQINDWKSEVDFNLRYHRWFLIPIGLWIPKKKFEKVLFRYCTFFTLLLLAIYVVPNALYIILAVSDHGEQLTMFGPLSFAIMAMGKYIFVLKHTHGIATCVRIIEEDWKMYINKPEEKQLMIEAGRWVDNFTKICVVFMIGGSMSHNVFVPLIEMIFVILTTPNATVMLNAPFYFGNRIYEDSTAVFVFTILFLSHSISFTFMNLVSVGLGTLMAKFVMHTCCQIEIMLKDFELTVNMANDENWDYTHYQANLKLVVIKHLRILRFIRYTEEIFTGVFFVEFIMSTIGICILGYYIMGALTNNNVSQTITYTQILIAYVTTIYVYCYLGNRLSDKCQRVGVRAYEFNWTGLLTKKYGDNGVQMMIMVSQHPPILTAGKLFFLTVQTFTSVIKASAAYLNMLRAVTNST